MCASVLYIVMAIYVVSLIHVYSVLQEAARHTNESMFVVGVYSESKLLGQGSGRSVKKAEQAVRAPPFPMTRAWALMLLVPTLLTNQTIPSFHLQAAQDALNKIWGEKFYTKLPSDEY